MSRAAWLRLVLGPVEAWPEELKVELREREAIAEFDGGLERQVAEQEALLAVRAELLGRPS